MDDNLKLGGKEITSIMVNTICIKMLLNFPRTIVINAGNAAWLQAIYMVGIVLIIFYVTTKIYTSNENIIDLSEKIGGKAFKIIIGVLTTLVLILNMSITMRAFPESIKMILLEETPMKLIILLFSIAVLIGVYNGLESISRITTLFLPIMTVIMIFFLLLLSPNFKATNILPIFGNGIKKITIDGFHNISSFGDLLILNLILSRAHDRETVIKSGYRCILISGLIMVLIHISFALVYPYPVSKDFLMPVYELTRILKIGDFFNSFDAVFEFLWNISMLLYGCVYIYFICETWQKSFDLKYSKPLILPMIIITSVISFLPRSIVSFMNIYNNFTYVLYIYAFGIPILIGILYKIRCNKKREKTL